MVLLLHKTALVNFPMATTVSFREWFSHPNVLIRDHTFIILEKNFSMHYCFLVLNVLVQFNCKCNDLCLKSILWKFKGSFIIKVIKTFPNNSFSWKLYLKENFTHTFIGNHTLYHFQCVFPPNMLITDLCRVRDPRVSG